MLKAIRFQRKTLRAAACRGLVAAACCLTAVLGLRTPAAAQPKPGGPPQGGPPVVAAPVVEDTISATQMFVGTVMPLRRASIGSAVDGRVTDFPVNEGDRVKKGDTLAQLLTETINQQIAAAEADLDLRQAELDELEAGSRPNEIEQARARMAAAQALKDYNAARTERTQSLFKQGRAVSREEVDEALSAARNADQTFLEAQAAYNLAVEGPRKERIAQARARVKGQQALVKQLKDQLRKHTVIAPFDGYVVAEHTEVGQWVNSGELVAEVVALDVVDVQVNILESQVPHVAIDMQVPVEVPALPGRSFTAKVALVVPQADARSRTFPVKVRLENEIGPSGPLLKAGMLTRVRVPTGGEQTALLIPKDALVLGGPSPMVYVIDPLGKDPKAGRVRPVPVQLGVEQGGLIQVEGDIRKGQKVVVLGNERLGPGAPVTIVRELPAGEALEPGATASK